jgi:hypothetical protein
MKSEKNAFTKKAFEEFRKTPSILKHLASLAANTNSPGKEKLVALTDNYVVTINPNLKGKKIADFMIRARTKDPISTLISITKSLVFDQSNYQLLSKTELSDLLQNLEEEHGDVAFAETLKRDLSELEDDQLDSLENFLLSPDKHTRPDPLTTPRHNYTITDVKTSDNINILRWAPQLTTPTKKTLSKDYVLDTIAEAVGLRSEKPKSANIPPRFSINPLPEFTKTLIADLKTLGPERVLELKATFSNKNLDKSINEEIQTESHRYVLKSQIHSDNLTVTKLDLSSPDSDPTELSVPRNFLRHITSQVAHQLLSDLDPLEPEPDQEQFEFRKVLEETAKYHTEFAEFLDKTSSPNNPLSQQHRQWSATLLKGLVELEKPKKKEVENPTMG